MCHAGQDRAALFDEIMTHVEQELGAAAGAYLMSVCLAAMRRPNEALKIIKQTEQALHVAIQQIDVAQQLAEDGDSRATTSAAAAAAAGQQDQPTEVVNLTRSSSTCSETTVGLPGFAA
jgi:hypothetical protein